MDGYATEFGGIPEALAANPVLRERVLSLIGCEPIPGKVVEGGNRLSLLRSILCRFVRGESSVMEASREVERQLERSTSLHAGSNRVFASGWAERLVRTQVSRFYNQAVLEKMIGEGIERCFIPHSSAEAEDSPCSQQVAGSTQDARQMHELIVRTYGMGEFGVKELKIPNHPHCTHVVVPAI